LRVAIREWNPWWFSSWSFPVVWISRDLLQDLVKALDMPHVKDIIGVRRCGKTTLAFQLVKYLVDSAVPPPNIVFLNFNDVVINAVDFQVLEKAINAIAPGMEYLFLDEVQEKAGWERWVVTLYDTHRVKQIFVTGSTSSLISVDIGRLLTGRHLTLQLFPFSFKETLQAEDWNGFEQAYLKKELNRLNGYLERFLLQGGFPEARGKDVLVARQVASSLFDDILAKDIASRAPVEFDKLRSLAQYTMTNFTREFSAGKVAKALNMHVVTVERYINLLEQCFAIFSLRLFSFKQLHQFHEARKFYAIDTGLRNHVAFQTTIDIGRMAENAVFLALKRSGAEIYYWKDGKHEADFLVTNGADVHSVVQVSWDITSAETRKREIDGIIVAAKTFGLETGTLLNRDVEGEEIIDGIKISFVPIATWLLSP
jgi:predicted AAA+ superfamily ATPase